MARTRWRNPIGFLPTPVTFLVVATYIALAAGLLYVHHVVPPAPKKGSSVSGVNVTEAWADLQALTGWHHPYNSHKNDEVRNWLLKRIDNILSENGTRKATEEQNLGQVSWESNKEKIAPVVVYNDLVSNATFYGPDASKCVYFEGTNIIVYIRGSNDDSLDWWNETSATASAKQKRGVLVNAHYDSVSTGLGATDDGVGVVSMLQLLKHYSKEGYGPKRGLVLLFNNGEEDFLNGAYAFMRHPISRFTDTFLNLEGAGAGGRATLFRSTDAEVTKYYGKSPHPFGTVLSADAFKRRLIRSDTDYTVFNGQLGMRGLDVAFFEPRARYHTAEDSARETSRASLWHMLSAALATTNGLTSDTKAEFKPGEGSQAVYFDVFGFGFGLMTLHGLFALSISLLVVAPIAIFATLFALHRLDRSYLFATKKHSDPLDPRSPDEPTVVEFGGWKGFTRFPIAFILATVAIIALAFLVSKVNPLIVYSSQYAVWSMMLSAWFFVAWFILRGADVMRPSALQRAHSLGWIFILSWVLLLAATVAEDQMKIGGGYFMTIYFAGAFVALLICYLEFLALPRRPEHVGQSSQVVDDDRPTSSSRAQNPEQEAPGSSGRESNTAGDNEEPTETTSLLGRSKPGSTTFNRFGRRSQDQSVQGVVASVTGRRRAFGEEQAWSTYLPSWLWALEFLVFAPFVVIFVGQIALLTTSSLHQTLADGNSALNVYLMIALLSTLLLVPASPFIHRIAARLPMLIFLIFAATLIYSLVAFPFSSNNRLKVFFRQDIDLDSGANTVSLTGIEHYLRKIIDELPSAAGQHITCNTADEKHKGLKTCSWTGLAPDVEHSAFSPTAHLESEMPAIPPEKRFKHWLSVNATRSDPSDSEGEAKIKLQGLNTRGCRLLFDAPISDYYVNGADERDVKRVPAAGTQQIRLWSREWDRHWTVHVKWNSTTEDDYEVGLLGGSGAGEGSQGDATTKSKKDKNNKGKGLDGTAVCLWSDANERGVIPAFDEVRLYMPVWAIATKHDDGLVMGSKRFLV